MRTPRLRGAAIRTPKPLLAAVASWGVQIALDRVCGMFAFALWDRSTRSLTLARDQLGEKPLYYGWSNGALIFGSELKSLLVYPGFDNAIDQEAITAFLSFSYVGAHDDLSEHPQAPTRPSPVLRVCPGRAGVSAILVARSRSVGRRPRATRRRLFCAMRSGRSVPQRRRLIANAKRCPSRLLPLRRHRFFTRRGAYAKRFATKNSHLLDRLRGYTLQRGGLRAQAGDVNPLRPACSTPARSRAFGGSSIK